MKIKSEIHSANIDKRGNVKKSLTYILRLISEEVADEVGPIMLGVFLFVDRLGAVPDPQCHQFE
jgi:hypothetical protein